MLEVAGEALETMSGSIRVVCNSELDMRDVETARAATYGLRRAWCASQPERFNSPQAQDRFARLYAFLRSGKMQIKVLPCAAFGLIHGKAGVIALADGRQTCFMGSANETANAWKLNYELVWEDDASEAIQWVQEEFEALWQSPSSRISAVWRSARSFHRWKCGGTRLTPPLHSSKRPCTARNTASGSTRKPSSNWPLTPIRRHTGPGFSSPIWWA